jgi:hypothetical protein
MRGGAGVEENDIAVMHQAGGSLANKPFYERFLLLPDIVGELGERIY